jgi:hypothetical protein
MTERGAHSDRTLTTLQALSHLLYADHPNYRHWKLRSMFALAGPATARNGAYPAFGGAASVCTIPGDFHPGLVTADHSRITAAPWRDLERPRCDYGHSRVSA